MGRSLWMLTVCFWKEPMMSDTSLSCGAITATDRCLFFMRVPRPALFSRPVLYVLFLILGCASGKTSSINPLNMCLNDISPVCLWECVCPDVTEVICIMDIMYQIKRLLWGKLIRGQFVGGKCWGKRAVFFLRDKSDDCWYCLGSL